MKQHDNIYLYLSAPSILYILTINIWQCTRPTINSNTHETGIYTHTLAFMTPTLNSKFMGWHCNHLSCDSICLDLLHTKLGSFKQNSISKFVLRFLTNALNVLLLLKSCYHCCITRNVFICVMEYCVLNYMLSTSIMPFHVINRTEQFICEELYIN